MEQKISTFQTIVLIANTITPTAVLVVPTIVIGAASQDAWLSIVLAWLCGIGFALLFASICKQNPGVPFLTLLENRLGRIVSVIVGVLLAQYYLAGTAIILREFVNFLTDELLVKTPVFVLAAASLIVVLYAVMEGLEVIARISIIVFLGSLVFLVMGTVLQFNQIHMDYLLPVGEATIPQMIQGSLLPCGWISESAILLLLSPYLTKTAKFRKIAIWGVSIAGCQLLIVVILVILIFGPELPKILTYSTFSTTEIIKYGNFLERVDIMFICIWIATVYVKLCIFFFGTVHCFFHSFRIRSYKPFQVALAVLVLLSALYSWPSNAYLSQYQKMALTPFLLTFNVLLPFVLWMLLQWKGRKTLGTGG